MKFDKGPAKAESSANPPSDAGSAGHGLREANFSPVRPAGFTDGV